MSGLRLKTPELQLPEIINNSDHSTPEINNSQLAQVYEFTYARNEFEKLQPYSLLSQAELYRDGDLKAVIRGDVIYVLKELLQNPGQLLTFRDFTNFGNIIETRKLSNKSLNNTFLRSIAGLSKVISLDEQNIGRQSAFSISSTEAQLLALKPIEEAKRNNLPIVKIFKSLNNNDLQTPTSNQAIELSDSIRAAIFENIVKHKSDGQTPKLLVDNATLLDYQKAMQRVMLLPNYSTDKDLVNRLHELARQIKRLPDNTQNEEPVNGSIYTKLAGEIGKFISVELLTDYKDIRINGVCADKSTDETVKKTENYYPKRGVAQDEQIAICLGCTVLNKCAEYAILNRERGTWGGLSEKKRRLFVRNFTDKDRLFLANIDDDHPLKITLRQLIAEAIGMEKYYYKKDFFDKITAFKKDVKNEVKNIQQLKLKN